MSTVKEKNKTLLRIERNILVLSGAWIAISFFCFGLHQGLGALLGCSLTLLNFRLIHVGVERLLDDGTSKSQKSYFVFTGLKFLGFTGFLIAAFYLIKPDLIFFIIGFSLFIPSILGEVLSFGFKNQRIGETISGC